VSGEMDPFATYQRVYAILVPESTNLNHQMYPQIGFPLANVTQSGNVLHLHSRHSVVCCVYSHQNDRISAVNKLAESSKVT